MGDLGKKNKSGHWVRKKRDALPGSLYAGVTQDEIPCGSPGDPQIISSSVTRALISSLERRRICISQSREFYTNFYTPFLNMLKSSESAFYSPSCEKHCVKQRIKQPCDTGITTYTNLAFVPTWWCVRCQCGNTCTCRGTSSLRTSLLPPGQYGTLTQEASSIGQ